MEKWDTQLLIRAIQAESSKGVVMDFMFSGRASSLHRALLHLTNGWHHSSHEVKRAGEVPARSDRVHADARHVRLLVAPEEAVQVLLAQVVLVAEVLEALRPALLGLALLGLLQRREHGGPAQQVDDDEQRQQQEARVVLVERSGAAAAAAPACHYVAVVTVVQRRGGAWGMLEFSKAHSPTREKHMPKKSPARYSSTVVRAGPNQAPRGCGCILSLRCAVRLSSPPFHLHRLPLAGVGCHDAQGAAESRGEPRSNLWMQRFVLLSCTPLLPLQTSPSPARAFYAPPMNQRRAGELAAAVHSSLFWSEVPPEGTIITCSRVPNWPRTCSRWTQPKGLIPAIWSAFAQADQWHLTFLRVLMRDSGSYAVRTRGRCEQMSPRNHGSK